MLNPDAIHFLVEVEGTRPKLLVSKGSESCSLDFYGSGGTGRIARDGTHLHPRGPAQA